MSSPDSKGLILAFLCNWAPYRCFLDLASSRERLAHPIFPIRVTCAGRIDPSLLLAAFEKGAEGVMVIGCKDKECRYGPGPDQIAKLAERIRAIVQVLGLESERFSILQSSSQESGRLFTELNSFAKKVSQLEKSPLVGY